MAELAVSDLTLAYAEGQLRRKILDIPALRIPSGQLAGLRGASGSGKTTLLGVLAGLVKPDTGTVRWGDVDIHALPEAKRDRWRGGHIGFVFQDFRLFEDLDALENVLLPVTFHHVCIPAHLRTRALELLDRMRVAARRKVRLLSRGERQRVALARAVLQTPELILADEPTASLDAANAAQVTDLLLDLAKGMHSTLLVVSHDAAVLERMDVLYTLERGLLGRDDLCAGGQPGGRGAL